LVDAHNRGGPATVVYCPKDEPERTVRIKQFILQALCPAVDDRCRWIAFDLDAADGHGSGGLLDPLRAAACIAERCDAAGLLGGVIVARSRSGKGRHLWLVTPGPVPLADAVLVTGGLAAQAMRIAEQDARETDRPHAFLCSDRKVAPIGRAGTFELIPPSTERPSRGWPLVLPGSGALAARGGGVIVDPFTIPPLPLQMDFVPRCDSNAWMNFLCETQAALTERQANKPKTNRLPQRKASTDSLSRIDHRTRDLLDGRCPKGERNRALFVAVANMVGVGVEPQEAARLALQGAMACGLSEREARATIRSALRAKGAT
jgi:hypothetical protein